MKQSTSFAQVATNQFDYLSSALCANTPPCKKHSSSRTFLTLSISLRFLLVMFLTLTVTTNAWGAEGDVVYTLSCVQSKSNSAYANYYDVTINSKQWNAPGNQTLGAYWRIGGAKGTSVSRYITGKSTIDKPIKKITVSHNGRSNSNLTVNSFSVTVAKDANFSNIVETKTISSPSVSNAGSFDLVPTNSVWETGCYYKFTIVYTHNNSSNYGLNLTSIVFYEGSTTPSCTNPTISTQPTGATYTKDDSPTALSVVASGDDLTYQWYSNTSNSTSGATKINGATNSTYTPSTSTVGTKYYYCIVSSGSCSTTSNIVSVVVKNPPFTVTLNAGSGTCAESVTEPNAGEGVTLPTPTLNCGDWEFAGWATSAVATETSSKPATLLTGTYKPTSNITLYAVYQRTDGGGGGGGEASLTEMVANNTLSDGDKIVVIAQGTYSDEYYNVAMYQETVESSYVNKWDCSNLTADVVAEDDKNWWTVTMTDGGFYLGDDTNGYLNMSSNNLYCNVNKSVWTLLDLKDGTFKLQSNSRNLSFRADLTNKYWRMGGKDLGTSGLTVLKLYKYTEGTTSTTYYHSTPDCGTTQPSVTLNPNGGDFDSEPDGWTKEGNNYVITHTGTEILLPTNISQENKNFVGWYDGETAYTTIPADLSESITLIAKWSDKQDPEIAWNPTTCTVTIDAGEELPTFQNPNELMGITFTSSHPSVASVDNNGVITLGTTATTATVTITATFDGNATYAAKNVTCTLTVNPSNCRWVETEIGDIDSGDEVVVMMAHGSYLYALPYDEETANNSNPAATSITLDDFEGIIVDELIWFITKDHESNNFTLSPKTAIDKYLTCNKSSNAVRINTGENRNFTIENDFLKNTAFSTYLAISTTATPKDWRHFESANKTISSKAQTLKLYKKTCLPANKFWIDYELANVTCTNTPPHSQIDQTGEDLLLEFSANDGYKLPESISVSIGNNILPEDNDVYIWDSETGELFISAAQVTDNITITIEGCELLAIPTNLKANNITSSSATLSWDEIDHATEYQVHITDDDNSTEDIITTTSNTYYEVTGLSSASEYLWGVTPIASGYCGITQEAEYFETLDVYTVTFNTDGGTDVAPQNVDHGTKATKPANPTKTGYTFAGWYTEADTEFDFNTPITSATTLYAKWNANQYTITLRQQWGDGGTETATVHFDNNDFSVSPIIVPTRNGYTFGGYYTAESGAGTQLIDVSGAWLNVPTYIEGGKWVYADDLTLYAKWTQNFTITWMANGQLYHTQTAMMGTAIAKPDDPKANELACDDKVFVGWLDKTISGSTNEEPTFVTDFGTIQANKTYYAVFAKLTGTPSNDYNQITDINDLTDGEYVIAYGYNTSSPSIILKAEAKDATKLAATSLEPTNNKYTSPAAANIWEIKKNGDNYSIYNAATKKYVEATTTPSVGLSDNPKYYTISWNSSPSYWKIQIANSTHYWFVGYIQGETKYFQSYDVDNDRYRIQLYKNASTAVYSDYVTTCVEIPTPHWEGAEIDNADIAVDCGAISVKSNASKITFDKNYDLTYPITLTASEGFLLSTNKQNGTYEQSVTVTPVQSGDNKGKITQSVYVRADATGKNTNFDGTITISGDQLAEDQIIEVHAVVDCPQYTLTFNDCGDTKTITDFAGTSVEEKESWAETCSEPFQYVFDGWAKAPVNNGTTEYEKVDFSTFTMPAENTTLYAVYRYAEEGSGDDDYHLVEEELTDYSGDYLIVSYDNNYAMSTSAEGEIGTNTYAAYVDISEYYADKIIKSNSTTDTYVFTATKTTNGYSLCCRQNNTYLAILNTSIGTGTVLRYYEESDYNTNLSECEWSIGVGSISNYAHSSYNQYIRWNDNPKRFAIYAPSSVKGIHLYKKGIGASYIYTSSLICGSITAEDALVTSTKEQTVKVYVPITLNYSEAASIMGTSDNEAFTVVTKNDVAVGESNIEVHYKPTAYVNTANQEETATITLTTSNGATTTFNVTGRCLPETFAIVAKVGNVWYALPSQGLNSGTTPVGYPVEVDNNDNPTAVTAVPENADWSLRQVLNDRFTANGENLVFVNAENKTLYASKENANIQTYAEYSEYATTNPDHYEWVPTTTDLTNYTLKNVGRDRDLSINVNATFGTHASNIASNNLRFLPINATYTPLALQVVEWKENSVVIMYNGDPAQTASVSVNGATAQNTTLSDPDAQRDIAVYELAADGLATNPTQRLSITIGSEKVILPIPYIVGGDLDDATLLGGNELTIARRQEIAKISDLVILKGATLTAVGAKGNPYKFRNVTIYGGGSLIIPADKGFGANTLTMRVGGVENRQYKNLYPQLQLKGTLTNTSGQINLDYLTTNDFYYPLSVPYSVTISDIQYPVDIYGANVASNNTGSFQFKYYDGAERAAGRTGWIVLDETAKPTLNPNTGYAIWGIPKKVKVNGGESTRQKFGIHRLPLKQTAAKMMESEQQSHSATINAYNGSKRDSDNGWNYLGNPYLSHYGNFTTADDVMKLGKLVWNEAQGAWLPTETEQRYVVFTNDCQNYTAELASDTAIPAFSAFFIQADQGGAINFTSPNVATPQSLAARRSEEETKEITTGIILSGEKHSDRTGLLIADLFTEAYEFNADLSKFDNQDMNLYTISSSGKLAFMAINEDLAKQTIPLGYSVSTDGMYSIAFDEQRYSRNDIYALYLIDYDRNETTNLLHMDYNFYSETGAHAERFALQVAFAPKTATDVEYTQVGDVLVSREGNTLRLDNLPSDVTVTVYDAVGHLVEQHTASQLLQLTLQKGYYLLHIGNNQNSVVIDTFIP